MSGADGGVSTMRTTLVALAVFAPIAVFATGAASAPAIRTNDVNHVPACVTPDRLMAFLTERNDRLDPRFRNIAAYYKHYGEGWRVRWDYAFFQMAIETNFLKFRRGDGRRGDVHETQNNFAGLGATGGGVRGERFPDVQTGVHAQIQHLVAYSGEHLAAPVAKRTREQQSGIIAQSLRLRRPVTFADLARRWAADRSYGKSIDFIANVFAQRYCTGEPLQAARDTVPPAPRPAQRRRALPFPPPSGLGGPKPAEIDDQSADVEITADVEELPWLAKPASPQKSQSGNVPSTPQKGAKEKSKTQLQRVRTIWSRDEVAPTGTRARPAVDSDGARPKPRTAIEPSTLIKPTIMPTASALAPSAKVTASTAKQYSPPADPQKPSVLPSFKVKPESADDTATTASQ